MIMTSIFFLLRIFQKKYLKQEVILYFKQLYIIQAYNGKEALELIEKRVKSIGKNYDLILMDLSMPIMDGYEAAKAIRILEKERGL